VVGPDGESLYIICGNGTQVPNGVLRYRPSQTNGRDHLMPSGFGDSAYTSAGFVMKFAPDGSDREIVCTGLRNCFDLAFDLDRTSDIYSNFFENRSGRAMYLE
jgi:hypothetical protein